MTIFENIKCTNMHVIGVAEEEERENGTKKEYKTKVKLFTNLVKKINLQF